MNNKIKIKARFSARNSALKDNPSLVMPKIKGLRVLVLGDDLEKLSLLLEELNNVGVKAIAAEINADGYRNALRFQPAVVISDLTSPGTSAWDLFSQFRRHPILRWTPVILMRWWSLEPDGEFTILTTSVTEKLGEALTPTRILEERIDAGRALGDQVELSGVLGVLKVIIAAGLNGTFSLNDSWNVFVAVVENRKVVSVHRRGVNGTEDSGTRAFVQLVMCDEGHWTFRVSEGGGRMAENIVLSFQGLVNFAMSNVSTLFGPDAFIAPETTAHLGIRTSIFEDVMSTMKGVSQKVIESIINNAPLSDLSALISSMQDRMDVEYALCTLVQCGAIISNSKAVTSYSDTEAQRIKRGVVHVFKIIRENYLHADNAPIKSSDHVTIVGKDRAQSSEVKYPSETAALYSESIAPAERPTPVISKEESVWRRDFAEGSVELNNTYSSMSPKDSLAPSPHVLENKKTYQMWLAVFLTVILSGLLVTVLVILNSDNRDHTEARTTIER